MQPPVQGDGSEELPKTRSSRDEKAKSNTESTSASHLLHESDEDAEPTKGWSTLFTFTTKAHILCLFGAIMTTVAAGVTLPLYNIFFGKAIDSFTDFAAGKYDKDGFLRKLALDCGVIAVIGIATWILDAASLASWILFGELQARASRERLHEGLQKKSIAWYDTRKTGIEALIPRAQTQIHELQVATSQPLGNALKALATSFTALGMGFYYSWSMTLVILASMPVCVILLAVVSVRLQQNIDSQQEHLTSATKQVVNAFNGIETVKYFNSQDFEARAFATSIKQAAVYYLRQANTSALQRAIAGFIGLCMFTTGFWYGTHLVTTGRISTAALVTTVFSVVTATSALQSILPNMLVLEKGKAAGAAIESLVPLSQKVDGPMTEGCVPPHCSGDIAFCHVNFAYPSRPSQIALEDISCQFPAGSTTFIIGHSGSGKSTIAQLLLRLYEPTKGDILLDGKVISELDTSWLRSHITLVEQQDVLFSGTIFENLALGSSDPSSVTYADAMDAVQFALLKETINDMPYGLDTHVGAEGKELSGGQRQRLALARARIRDSTIVIMDEFTSALDQISRSLILSAMRKWRQGRTTILISHDISQIEQDDYVCVFDSGCLAEQGYRYDLEKRTDAAFQTFLAPTNPNYLNGDMKDDEDNLPSSAFTSPNIVNHQYVDHPAMQDHCESLNKFDSPLRMNRFSRNSFTNYMLTRIPDCRLTPRPASIMSSVVPSYDNIWSAKDRFEVVKTAKSRPVSIAVSTRTTAEVDLDRTQSTSNRLSKNAWAVTNQAGLIAAERRAARMTRARRVHGTVQADKVFDGADMIVSRAPSMRVMLRTVLPELNKSNRVRLVLGFIAASIHSGAIPTYSYLVAKLLNTLYQGQHGSKLATTYSAATLGVAAIDAVATYLYAFNLEVCAQAWASGVRVSAVMRILDQPRQFLADKHNGATHLAQTLDRNGDDLRNLLGRFVALIYQAVLLMIVGFAWSFTACWKLAFVGLAVVPLPLTSTKCFQIFSERYEKMANEAAEAIGDILSESCLSPRTVRALMMEDHFRKKHTAACNRTFAIGVRRALFSGFFYGLSEATPDFYNAVLYYTGGRFLTSGDCEIQGVLTVFTMLLFAVTNLTGVVNFLPQINSAKHSAASLLHLAHELPERSHEHEGDVRLTSIGDISFRNVSFAYPSRPHELVLRNVSLDFPAGTVAALVGLSGSGKSTIASLLLRLYPLSSDNNIKTITNGRISIGNRPLTRLHTPTLRSLIAVVPQTCLLFPGTITHNITYGLHPTHPFAAQDSVAAAAEAAGIHAFIMSLRAGYDTLVGPGGTTLSGGQTQRLAIARALVRKPKLLILDEATSALDAENAVMVRDTIARLVETSRNGGIGANGVRQKLTVIAITHDKEMMRLAERIVMLEKGVVVDEGGGFEQMVKKGGRFAELMRGGVWVVK